MMQLSLVNLSRVRQDRRPLYRRILTNRRLDIAHKTAVRTILGFILFSTSYCVVNGIIYYQYIRPIKQEEKELLERELIEADRAGFAMKLIHQFLFKVNSRLSYVFVFGIFAGAGFELFKIHFKFRGVSYYSVYKDKQLHKQLESFENGLRETDRIIANSPEFANIRRMDAPP
ncbi:unnamed protein product [Anisakis simplex]|uniref:Uncharacterized protein n=1 Tax=Anisakis simplex TaxID=6269 RepID=A0A3P6NWD0_ANISI|nr:unnamed protein product [Anisakis simplex]